MMKLDYRKYNKHVAAVAQKRGLPFYMIPVVFSHIFWDVKPKDETINYKKAVKHKLK